MKIFRIDESDKLIQYTEYDFKKGNLEENLEFWLENNPSCILEDEKVLIIGRQVATNLGSIIDLLAIDKIGDLVVIELKRERTPRDTLAQILEYASFVENLTYKQLEEIFMEYTNEENINLTDYHRNYFNLQEDEAVAFNKNQKLVIIAQNITRETKQVSTYLGKKDLNIYCLEFKYFKNQDGQRIISTDFVVGKDSQAVKKVSSGSLPRVDRDTFMAFLDLSGKEFFKELLDFAEENNFPIHWGSKGFSVNVDLSGNHVNVLYGYPPHAVYKQSIYTVFAEILRKVKNAEDIVKTYKEKLEEFGGFEPAGSELKYMIKKPIPDDKKKEFLTILSIVTEKIRESGPTE